MFARERVRRRRVLVQLIAVLVLLDAALFAVQLQAGNSGLAAASTQQQAGDFVPDDTTLRDCTDPACFWQAFGNVAYREGPREAFGLISSVYGDGGSLSCHRITHAIGAATLARLGGDVARTLALGTDACGSGYFHGVLERSLKHVPSRTSRALAAVARTLCRGPASATPWRAFQCLHGLGHGVMVATGMNLPRSLEVCARLARAWDTDACRTGVFMENLQSPSRWVRADDALYPCTAVARESKRRCYQLVTSRMLHLSGEDWEATSRACSRVEAEFVFMCFRSLGRDASSRNGRDTEEILRFCALARPFAGEPDCIVGAAMDVATNWSSGSRAAGLCVAVADELRASCYFGVGAVIARLRTTPSARLADCRGLASQARLVDACLRGGRSALPRS